MNAMNETSLTRAADPASVFMGSTLDTSTGSVVFDGLEKGGPMDQEVTPASTPHTIITLLPVATEPETAPVAGGLDSTPTNWFELAKSLCIPDVRLKNAFDAFSEAVSRE